MNCVFILFFALYLTTPSFAVLPPPRDSVRKWMEASNLIGSSPSTDLIGRSCTLSNELSLGWEHLRTLPMNKQSKYGILLYAWPRLDSFYASKLEAITASTSSLEGLEVCDGSSDYDPLVCDNGKCTWCRLKEPLTISPDSVVCKDLTFGDPEKAKVNWDRIRELKRDVIAPEVTNNPGIPSASELVAWMNSKLEKDTGRKDGETCYASLSSTWSLSYLRAKFFEPGKRTVEQVQDELLLHPEYYWEHLRWLTGVDPSQRVICAEGLFCGREGLCVNCTLAGSKYSANLRGEDSRHLRQLCVYRSTDKFDSEPFHAILKTSYKSPRDAFRKWFSAGESILRNAVNDSTSDLDQEFCSASVEQTISWTHLAELFINDKSGSIMVYGWSWISAYEKDLSEVLKDGVAESYVFCSWNVSSGEKLLCASGRCVNCSQIPKDPKFDDYKMKCRGNLGSPMDRKEGHDSFRRLELDRVILKLERLEDFPAEVVSSEDASRWKRNFEKTATLGKFEDCDAPAELTLSQKFLLRKWPTGKDAERDHKEDLKWLVGEDEKRGRKMCGNGLVCGPEGICVPCGITTGKVKELNRVCEEFGEKRFYVENKDEIPPKPTRPGGQSTTMASGSTADESEGGENKGCMVGVSSKGLVFMIVSVFAFQL